MAVTPAVLTQNISTLDRLMADLKAKVGAFLGNEEIIYDAQTKINQLVSSGAAPIQAQAKALAAKGQALLKIQKDVEAGAQSIMGQIGALQTQIQTNPQYAFLKDSPTSWGIRMYEILGNLISQTASFIPQAASVAARATKQNSDVKTFANEVDGSLSAAAGQGALPAIRGVISSTIGATASSLSSLVWPIAIVAVGALVLYGGASGFLRRRS